MTDPRPVIGEYSDPVDYVRDMIAYRKKTERSFSVVAATRPLRRVSPALVSLVLKRKRGITFDRADEFARLLDLNSAERFFFRNWIGKLEEKGPQPQVDQLPKAKERKEVATSILNDWINVYVKDFFQIPEVQKNPSLIASKLLSVASPQRIEKAMQFLIREGYLRRTLEGQLVLESNLAVADPKVPSQKIRQFHKGALQLARQAVDLYPPSERLANTLIIPLDEQGYSELMDLVREFAEKIQDFAAARTATGDRLYQVLVNVSPVGGKIE